MRRRRCHLHGELLEGVQRPLVQVHVRELLRLGEVKVVVMKRIKREMMMKLMKRIHVGEG